MPVQNTDDNCFKTVPIIFCFLGWRIIWNIEHKVGTNYFSDEQK